MAVRSTRVTATTTAAKVVTGSDADDNVAFRDVMIKNTGATTAYVGGADVTSANGFPLDTGEGVEVGQADATNLPYAVTASGTTTLAILETRV